MAPAAARAPATAPCHGFRRRRRGFQNADTVHPGKLAGVHAASLPLADRTTPSLQAKSILDAGRNSRGQRWRNCVGHLPMLVEIPHGAGPAPDGSLKHVAIGESLDSRCLPRRQVAILGWMVRNLAASQSKGWPIPVDPAELRRVFAGQPLHDIGWRIDSSLRQPCALRDVRDPQAVPIGSDIDVVRNARLHTWTGCRRKIADRVAHRGRRKQLRRGKCVPLAGRYADNNRPLAFLRHAELNRVQNGGVSIVADRAESFGQRVTHAGRWRERSIKKARDLLDQDRFRPKLLGKSNHLERKSTMRVGNPTLFPDLAERLTRGATAEQRQLASPEIQAVRDATSIQCTDIDAPDGFPSRVLAQRRYAVLIKLYGTRRLEPTAVDADVQASGSRE